jgi:simple sugar transport system permease protein
VGGRQVDGGRIERAGGMSTYSVRPEGRRTADFLAEHAQVLSIAAFFLTCCIVFALATDAFLTAGNLLNLLRQAAPLLIVAVAMTFVITTGGIDLSVGSTVALVNAVAAIAMVAGLPWPAVVAAMLALGAAIGVVQGWFVAYQAIPSFIVTLAGLSALRGLALLLTQGYSIPIPASDFSALGRGWLLGVPFPAVIAVLAALLGYLALNEMRYGRRVIAIGANAEAARRVGMPARRVTMSVYVLTGVAAALAGLVVAARLGSGSSNAAVGFELDVIAAVVLGGTSLSGGRGTIPGTVLGALTIAVIGNGLILAHVSPFFTQIVTGVIILAAIWLNTRIFGMRLAPRRRAS